MGDSEMRKLPRRRKVSKRQVDFLEYLIWKSKDASPFAKKCLIYLVRQSCRLSREVQLACRTDEVVHGFHDMGSSNGSTHIGAIFCLTGAEMIVDYGIPSIRNAYPRRHEVAIEFSPTREEIEAIVPRSPYRS